MFKTIAMVHATVFKFDTLVLRADLFGSSILHMGVRRSARLAITCSAVYSQEMTRVAQL